MNGHAWQARTQPARLITVVCIHARFPLIAKVERVQLAVNALTFDVRELDADVVGDPAVVNWIAKQLAVVSLSQGDIRNALSLRLGGHANPEALTEVAAAFTRAATAFRVWGAPPIRVVVPIPPQPLEWPQLRSRSALKRQGSVAVGGSSCVPQVSPFLVVAAICA